MKRNANTPTRTDDEASCQAIAWDTTGSKQAIDQTARKALRKLWRMQVVELRSSRGFGDRREVIPWWRGYGPWWREVGRG